MARPTGRKFCTKADPTWNRVVNSGQAESERLAASLTLLSFATLSIHDSALLSTSACGQKMQLIDLKSFSLFFQKLQGWPWSIAGMSNYSGLTWCCNSTKSCNLGTMATQWLGLGLGWVTQWQYVWCCNTK